MSDIYTSQYQFWKEVVILQICSGTMSFAASSVIVIFITKNGLDTPYRRIIFGLSVSDMCQSFAIFAGPFLIQSDIPQAFWGIGNKHSCRLDGFLYLVGVTAVPMYTVFLCIYYVNKLKNRVTDDDFTQRIEKKIHIGIIVINLGLYLTALGMDLINPMLFGNSCGVLANAHLSDCVGPETELFWECDIDISGQPAVVFFSGISNVVVPVFSIIGMFVCMSKIFWHVLMRERVFATSHGSKTNITEEEENAGGMVSENNIVNPSRNSHNHSVENTPQSSGFANSSSEPSSNLESRNISSSPTSGSNIMSSERLDPSSDLPQGASNVIDGEQQMKKESLESNRIEMDEFSLNPISHADIDKQEAVSDLNISTARSSYMHVSESTPESNARMNNGNSKISSNNLDGFNFSDIHEFDSSVYVSKNTSVGSGSHDLQGFSKISSQSQVDVESSGTTTNIDMDKNESSTENKQVRIARLELPIVSHVQGHCKMDISGNWSSQDAGSSGMSVSIFPSNETPIRRSPHRNHPSVLRRVNNDAVAGTSGASQPSTDVNAAANVAETLSRLYKRELLTQVCCYVLVFCFSTMPFLILTVRLVMGIQASKTLLRVVFVLYPLAGLFNIIVYTRWNVASYRREHPECSWLLSFWLVLKAGGGLPSDDE